MNKKFCHLQQPDAMDCGAACLAMLSKHYGKTYTIQRLREMCSASRAGVSMLGISDAAEKLGFKTLGVHKNFEQLFKEAPMPFIAHWRQEHFVVVYKIRLILYSNVKSTCLTADFSQNPPAKPCLYCLTRHYG
jgi:ATP-binding cassette subfamily B protein